MNWFALIVVFRQNSSTWMLLKSCSFYNMDILSHRKSFANCSNTNAAVESIDKDELNSYVESKEITSGWKPLLFLKIFIFIQKIVRAIITFSFKNRSSYINYKLKLWLFKCSLSLFPVKLQQWLDKPEVISKVSRVVF